MADSYIFEKILSGCYAARLTESQALKLAMPSKLYSNFLQDKVKKRCGGNPINVNRLSKN